MKNKNFFDELEQGWEDVMQDTYKRHADYLLSIESEEPMPFKLLYPVKFRETCYFTEDV